MNFKKLIHSVVPWLITAVALYFAFRGIEIGALVEHLSTAHLPYLGFAVLATFASYLLRAFRWQYFFLTRAMKYSDAVRVLILGFFMNNILPARAGELVRAHTGSKLSGETRTLVLATIASERLIDGVTISLMFILFATGIGDPSMSNSLLYVAAAFGAATLGVIIVLLFREKVFSLAERVHGRFRNKASSYTLDRFRIFINGLSPLFMKSRLPIVILLSAIVWSVELAVYFFIARAFDSSLSLSICVLFLVAVNFSSLIPAAPGGIGVIEAVASAVLASVGVPREQALTMVICQHVIQYLVVGIPGLMIILTWKRNIRSLSELTGEEAADGGSASS